MNADFEQSAEEFLQQINKEYYKNGAGLKESLDIIPIYEKYGWLFEKPTVEKALARQDTEGKEIAVFVADGYLDANTSELNEKITNAMTKATIEWQGKNIPYRQASLIIANEPDSSKRHELESKVQKKTNELNPDNVTRMEKSHSLAKGLGFENYLEMFDQLKKLRLKWLSAKMQELLDRSEEVYISELEYYLSTIDVSLHDATTADLSYIFRAPQFDKLFPQEKLVPSLTATFSGMGIDLKNQTNVIMDTESRPLKSPRAFCAPVHVPDEVYLVISPKGGQDDYKAILHESGHAEHFGHVSPDLPFAYKRLGDGAISESYAFLMDNLMKNHHWFAEIMGEHHVDDYLRLSRFHKLWILRRYAAKLQYEMLLHTSSDIPAMKEKYSEILNHALKVKISPVNFLSDVDDAFYAANYLRAWIFEVMLRKHLENNYGNLWFKKPEAGKFLIEMWSQGQKYPVDELAHQLHYEQLDAEPLILELSR